MDGEDEEYEDEFDPFDNDEPAPRLSITEIDENLEALKEFGFFFGNDG